MDPWLHLVLLGIIKRVLLGKGPRDLRAHAQHRMLKSLPMRHIPLQYPKESIQDHARLCLLEHGTGPGNLLDDAVQVMHALLVGAGDHCVRVLAQGEGDEGVFHDKKAECKGSPDIQ